MNNMGNMWLIGLAAGLLVGVIFLKLLNKNKKIKTDYDERQELIRGKGYKYAMFTTWVLLFAYITSELSEINLHMDRSLVLFSIIFISAAVQISYSLWNDAYFGGNNDVYKYNIFFVILIVLNAGATVGFLRGGMLIEDGCLTFRAINGECAVLLLIVLIQYYIRNKIVKREEQEDEDEES